MVKSIYIYKSRVKCPSSFVDETTKAICYNAENLKIIYNCNSFFKFDFVLVLEKVCFEKSS